MGKQATIFLGAILVLVLIVTLAFSGHLGTQTGQQGSIQYTDAITGQPTTDIVGENTNQAPVTFTPSTTSIAGSDSLSAYLTTEQVASVQTILDTFLMAHSGLASVQAGIKNDQIIQNKDGSLSFTLMVIKPQYTYAVTVAIANQAQTIPDVTIKPVEQ